MAVTCTNRGTGATNTGDKTTLVVTPASNFNAGTLAVLCIAYDNSGTNGADPYSSITDSNGNTWTPRANVLNDPGGASAGCCLRFFTSPMASGVLTTSDTITVDFGGKTTTARSWTLYELGSSVGVCIGFYSHTIAFDQTGNDDVCGPETFGLSSNVEGAISAIAREGNDSVTVDPSWSNDQHSGIGTTSAGSQIISQFTNTYTVVNAYVHQTSYGAARDFCAAIVVFRETSLATPSVLSSTFSIQSPSVSGFAIVSPSILSATFSLQAVIVEVGSDITVTINVLSSTFSVQSPSVSGSAIISQSVLSGVFSVQAPSISGDCLVTPGVLSLTGSVQAPLVKIDVSNSISVLSTLFSIQDPSILAGGNVDVFPSILSSIFSIQTSLVSADSNASILVISGTFTFQEPDINISSTLLISVFEMTLTIFQTIFQTFQSKQLSIFHARIKRTTDIIRVRKDDFNPMTLILDFEHTLPDNYYLDDKNIIYGLYLDREFVREFRDKTVKVQVENFDVVNLIEVFAHPHAGFKFIRTILMPGNKIRIRFRARNPSLKDIQKHILYWDNAGGTYLPKAMGEIDALTGETVGRYVKAGRIA